MRKPTDKCLYCNHPRSDHNPPTTYQSTNSTRSMTSKGTKVIAKTCCWSNPLCCCIAFVEQNAEGPHWFEFTKLYLTDEERRQLNGTGKP